MIDLDTALPNEFEEVILYNQQSETVAIGYMLVDNNSNIRWILVPPYNSIFDRCKLKWKPTHWEGLK